MNINNIIKEVCEKYSTSRNDIFSQRRNKQAVTARKIIYKVLTLDGKSSTQVGAIMGRDHSTVTVGLRALSNEDEEYSTYLYLKHRETEEVSKTINKEIVKKIITEDIKNYFNRGYSASEISQEVELDEGIVKAIINTIIRNYKTKKVPDYRNGTYRYIYL